MLSDRVGSEVAGRRLGPPPPRPRRADLHRPARPHRPGPARLQPRRGGRARTSSPTSCAPRTCSRAARRGRPPLARRRSTRAADGRVRGPGRRGRAALRRRDAAVRDRGLLAARSARTLRLRYRYLDLRRERMRDALVLRHRVTTGDARVPRRRGLPRDRDAGADPLDARGRPRLPRPQPPAAGLLLRAAAVAAALQAAADGRRLRALLPDRPLLPRRGPARRPPARLHPARHRDVVRRGRGRDRRSTSGCSPTCSAVGGVEARAAAAAPALRRGDRPLRHRQARPALRPRAASSSPTSCARPSSRPSAARSTTAAWSAALNAGKPGAVRARSSTG